MKMSRNYLSAQEAAPMERENAASCLQTKYYFSLYALE